MTTIIRDRVFTTMFQLADLRDVTLENCDFSGTFTDEGALKIRGCHNIEIRYCRFHDLATSGIVIQSTSPSSNISIHHNELWNIKGNGIITKLPNSFVTIFNNRITNVGANDRAHPIYCMTPGTLIEDNIISGTAGDGITIRTDGVIRGNRIWKSAKAAIRYFSDGRPGDLDSLVIEENYCVGSGAGYPVISLLWSPSTVGQMLSRYRISCNTLTSTAATSPAFAVQSSQFAGKVIVLNDNVHAGALSLAHVTAARGNVEV